MTRPIGISVPHRKVEDEPQIAINSKVVGYVVKKRAWVSLTDKQIHECIAYGKGGCEIEQTAKNIELKLKALNYD